MFYMDNAFKTHGGVAILYAMTLANHNGSFQTEGQNKLKINFLHMYLFFFCAKTLTKVNLNEHIKIIFKKINVMTPLTYTVLIFRIFLEHIHSYSNKCMYFKICHMM